MRVTNSKTEATYVIYRAKYQANAAWCASVKPVTINLGGDKVAAHYLPEKSDYVYFQYKGWAHCVWAKTSDIHGFVKEKGTLKVVEPAKGAKPAKAGAPISAAKAGVKPEAKKRPIRVVKPSGEVKEVTVQA